MKRGIGICCVLLIALSAFADGRYLFLWANETMSASDRQKTFQKIKSQFNDAKEVNPADLPRWRVIANTNIVGRVLCIDIAGKHFSFTKADADAWKEANLDEPNKLQWSTGEGPEALYDGGVEPVPGPPLE